ncbi:uncharacterized protein TM35_000065020 [Trypanosoma theileri]|uniref:Uncharacterized protein n=1 Tax=Trypanosoma theileri TaxID=67003 RepID=A0A1X0P3K2_9TRYP|nr:uncharacterized protein TM35_000065020 [Trypanosoma theileri]ORC91497.1 hypothetical protein TM35_000065020 [Trypanosoma theileri]
MQHHSRDIVKDVSDALQLEQELQLSQAQHGVAVLDIYSSEWGSTKALSETFRRLYTDAGDQMHLRFYAVECNSILESLKYPEEQRNPMRPKNLDLCRETLPSFWKDILDDRRGKSKSYFVFYKEGKKRTWIEGINTPKIINYVRDLCRPQKPANECASNKELLEFWEHYFSAEESEVFFDSFIRAMLDCIGAKRSLTNREEKALAEAIGVQDYKVTVGELEKWIGGERTIQTAFCDLFPAFRDRITSVSASAVDGSAADIKPNGVNASTDEVAMSQSWNEAEKLKTPKHTDDDWRPQLWHTVAAMPLRCPGDRRFVLLSSGEGEEKAKEDLQRVIDVPTLNSYLTEWGVSADDIQVMCHSAARKFPFDCLSYGKLALTLMLCDSDGSNVLVGRPESFVEQLSDGSLLESHTPIAFTVICTCASETHDDDIFYYYGEKNTVEFGESCEEGGQVILAPLTRLQTSSNDENPFNVRIIGMPKVIRLPETVSENETTVLIPWYTKFVVKEKLETGITLTFLETVDSVQYRHSVNSYTERLLEDEDKLAKSADVASIFERYMGSKHELEGSLIKNPSSLGNGVPDVAGEEAHSPATEELQPPDDAENKPAAAEEVQTPIAEEQPAAEEAEGKELSTPPAEEELQTPDDVENKPAAEEEEVQTPIAEEQPAAEEAEGKELSTPPAEEELQTPGDVENKPAAEEEEVQAPIAEEQPAAEETEGKELSTPPAENEEL